MLLKPQFALTLADVLELLRDPRARHEAALRARSAALATRERRANKYLNDLRDELDRTTSQIDRITRGATPLAELARLKGKSK